MIVYHYSATLKEGDRMIPGYQNNNSLCEPFIQALEHSKDCFLWHAFKRKIYVCGNESIRAKRMG